MDEVQIRVVDGMNLHNERLRAKNIEKGKPETEGFLTREMVGMHLYPLESYKERQGKKFEFKKYLNSVHVSIGDLIKGRMKKVDKWWIPRLCELFRVDPNFMYGVPSVYDEEFNQLVTNKSEK